MWVLGLVILIDQADQNILRGVIPQLKHDFGIGDGEIGLLLSIFVLVNGLVTVPAGYLADRWHRTRTIGHTVVAWSALTDGDRGVAELRADARRVGPLLGFGQGVTEPSANALISDYYPTDTRASAFSLQQIMGIVGAAIGIGVGGAIGSAFGWQWAFLAIGPPGFVIAAGRVPAARATARLCRPAAPRRRRSGGYAARTSIHGSSSTASAASSSTCGAGCARTCG